MNNLIESQSLNPALTEIAEVDVEQVKFDHETAKYLANLAWDLQPLLARESECFKRKKTSASAQPNAESVKKN
jgi:hypothetical protein